MGARVIRGRSQESVIRGHHVRPVKRALDDDLARIETEAPRDDSSLRGGAVGGSDGQPARDGPCRVAHGRQPAVRRRRKGRAASPVR